jgi:hypothetical protein
MLVRRRHINLLSSMSGFPGPFPSYAGPIGSIVGQVMSGPHGTESDVMIRPLLEQGDR